MSLCYWLHSLTVAVVALFSAWARKRSLHAQTNQTSIAYLPHLGLERSVFSKNIDVSMCMCRVCSTGARRATATNDKFVQSNVIVCFLPVLTETVCARGRHIQHWVHLDAYNSVHRTSAYTWRRLIGFCSLRVDRMYSKAERKKH